jgi:tripartite-type tricarboxylate transporter receptor subunit TctC
MSVSQAGVEVQRKQEEFVESLGRVLLVAISLAVPLVATAAGAVDYPTRPVRIIVPLVPGGINDLLARAIGASLGERMGQQFVIDNRPGANTIVGTDLTAKAPPDGHTLLIVPGGHAINPSMYRKLPYDTVRDFAGVALIGYSPYVLAVSTALGVTALPAFIDLAKSKPGQISFSSSGVGNVTHLAGELLNLTAGIKLTHVPYKGTGQLLPDLLTGAVPVSVISFSSGLRYMKTGKLNLLGVTTVNRNPALPELPTLAEAGIPGYEVSGWYGFVAPAATPRAIVNRLNNEIQRALRSPDLNSRVSAQGVDIVYETPAHFDAYIRTEITKWQKVVERLGIAAE